MRYIMLLCSLLVMASVSAAQSPSISIQVNKTHGVWGPASERSVYVTLRATSWVVGIDSDQSLATGCNGIDYWFRSSDVYSYPVDSTGTVRTEVPTIQANPAQPQCGTATNYSSVIARKADRTLFDVPLYFIGVPNGTADDGHFNWTATLDGQTFSGTE
jgi:hypothetical protein